tara:strand:+ start:1535 stop:2812 length:1278 start_codon:yes stop_codon:yes gene_type:complete
MQRRVYCVGLRKHVEADIDDIVPITGKRGTKYQCVGKYSENGKDYVVKSWVPKADYEALHGTVIEVEDIVAAEEFNGADVEAAEPLAADPVADSPVAEDSSEPLEVAPADKSYFLSESVVLSAIKEMAAEDEDPETITYDCISCGEEIDDEDGHELVGEFQEKCCLPCFKTAFGAEQTFEAQQKERKDYISEQNALRLITGAYGVKSIVSGPTYYRFVEGTSSKFLMFAVVERNNGTFQAVNVYGRRGANFPSLWMSDPYPTEAQAERASKAKQNKKSRKGYVFLDAEEFRAFLAEHFNSETLNSSESIDNYMSESPLDESPVDEDPLTADPSDLGGPEDFSADATIDLEDGEITIHEKGAKSGGSKKLLLGVILVAGLAAAYQNSDAVLEFFEGLKTDADEDLDLDEDDENGENGENGSDEPTA